MHEIDIWSFPRGHQDNDSRKKKKMKEICTDWYKTNWSSNRKDNDLSGRKRLSADITRFFFLQMKINRSGSVRLNISTARYEFLVELKKKRKLIGSLIDSSFSDDPGQYLREFFTYSSNQMNWIKSKVHGDKKMNITIIHLILI